MDPWTALLTWLQTLIVPNWGELVAMLPLFLLIGLVGPILTLIALAWVWYFLHRRRGHARVVEPDVVPAELDPDGMPVFPPNVPFCETHALVFPVNATRCSVDDDLLSVTCPVDRTVRVAEEQVCRACGTRYVLGAAIAPLSVRRIGHPPEGGAAVA